MEAQNLINQHTVLSAKWQIPLFSDVLLFWWMSSMFHYSLQWKGILFLQLFFILFFLFFPDCLQWACAIRYQTWSRGWQLQHIWNCNWSLYCNTCTMIHQQLPWSGSCVLTCCQAILPKNLFWWPWTPWHNWLLLHWLIFQIRLDTRFGLISFSVRIEACCSGFDCTCMCRHRYFP